MDDLSRIDLSGVKIAVRFKNIFAKFDALHAIKPQSCVRLYSDDYSDLCRKCAKKFGDAYGDLKSIRYRGLKFERVDQYE